MSKTTPAPWRYRPAPISTAQRAKVFGPAHPVDGGDYAPICETALPGDAMLISAAPDMLAALKLAEGRLALLLRIFPDEHDECDHPVATTGVHKSVLAAIARAEGREG